jgi:hypothetical protein
VRSRSAAVVYVAAALAWIALRVSVFSKLRLIEFPDSESFLAKAAEPLWTRDYFLGSGRFFVVPLFYKVVFAVAGPDKANVALAQFLLSTGAWLTLAWALARQMAPVWLGIGAFAAVLAFGLSTEVTQWDVMVLSESVSTSLFALLMAIWIGLPQRLSNRTVAGAAVIAAAWSLSREANSLLVLPLAVAVAAWGTGYAPHRLERLRAWTLAGILVSLFAGTAAISGSGDRWVFPLLNVIGTRVLPSAERTAYYQSHGMPVNPTLQGMAGEFGSGKNWAFYGAPDLEEFRRWLRVRGKNAFAWDLAAHPRRTLTEPLVDVHEFICPALSPYRYDPFPTLYASSDGVWFCQPRAAGVLVAMAGLLGLALAAAAFALRARVSAIAGFRLLTLSALLLGWLPFVWFTWHVIGGMEVGRHEWSGVLVARVGVLLLSVYAVQGTITGLRSRARRG